MYLFILNGDVNMSDLVIKWNDNSVALPNRSGKWINIVSNKTIKSH